MLHDKLESIIPKTMTFGGSTRGSALAVRYATEGLANRVVAVAKLISK